MITRFAPSPTGPLHLGHAYSALLAHDMAKENNGIFLLRIEDIDQSRAKPHWVEKIYEDLHWLGISWAEAPLFQSQRIETYRAVIEQLYSQGKIYPCQCNRKDIAAAISAPQEGAPLFGPDGLVYPGTCAKSPRPAVLPAQNQALRLDMTKSATQKLSFEETGPEHDGLIEFTPQEMVEQIGDIVLARRDMGTSYHLSVVLDDAAQGVSHVFRGEDLFEATKIHVQLQHMLRLPSIVYHHHRLIRDENNKRLAKRDDARAISKYRDEGYSPADIRNLVGL